MTDVELNYPDQQQQQKKKISEMVSRHQTSFFSYFESTESEKDITFLI